MRQLTTLPRVAESMTTRPKGIVLAATLPDGVPADEVLDSGLVPVANKPLLVYALQTLRAAGVREAAIVADGDLMPSMREALEGFDHGLRLRFIGALPSAGVIAALRAAQSFLGDRPCLLHTLDGLMVPGSGSLQEELEATDADAAFVTRSRGTAESSLTQLAERRLLHVCDPAAGPDVSLAGLVWLSPRVVSRAVARGPASVLADPVEAVAAEGGRGVLVSTDAAWLPITGGEELLDANRAVLDRLGAPPDLWSRDGVDVQGRAWIHPSARLEATVVRGPSIIGPDADLRHAYVGPYTSIGEGVTIEGAEVEHSILLAGADIRNLGKRLEASVVGRRARVFRDFALPRALRVRVGDGDEISLA